MGRAMVLYANDIVALDRNNQFPALLFPPNEMGSRLHGQDQAKRCVLMLDLIASHMKAGISSEWTFVDDRFLTHSRTLTRCLCWKSFLWLDYAYIED